jgi:1-acyl-sn-glycerol-3-phosphate acyltransferase
MTKFFKKPKQKLTELADKGRDKWLYQMLPQALMEALRLYLRVEVVGMDKIPRKGSGIIAPNHSGFSGFDALLLAHLIHKDIHRIPRVLTHHLWFMNNLTAVPAQKMGFTEANFENGLNALQRNNLIVLFPEGEFGNFKPSTQAYQLQEFKRGFVRMALTTQAPIIPTLVIGAEETHINLRQLKLGKFLPGAVFPLPLNLIPLPVKWKIVFMDPIRLPYSPSAVEDRDLVLEICEELQETMQEALSAEIVKRGNRIFL